MEARDPASDNNDRGVLSALRDFFDAARRTPRDVIVVFLGMAVLGIVSYQLGSKRFFIDHWYQELSANSCTGSPRNSSSTFWRRCC